MSRWRTFVVIMIPVIAFSIFVYKIYSLDKLARKDFYSSKLDVFNMWSSIDDYLIKDDILLRDMHIEELKFILHGILSMKMDVCKNSSIFGRTHADGGYSVCTSGNLAPEKKSCLALSFGINNEWSFDDGIAGYGCYVHSFDPSMGLDDHMHKPNVAFHNIGLGRQNLVIDKGWKMKNLITILKELKLSDKVIDVIKCDAEGAEWPFLEELVSNRIKVKQIILEIHSFRRKPEVNSREDYIYMINLFQALKKMGYFVWMNNHIYSCCAAFSNMMPRGIPEKCCYEVYLYNTNYVD